MLRSVVVYRSISGFTRKYAEWIAQDLKADIFDVRDVNLEKLSGYDLIIFGGSVHIVGINGIKIIKENLQGLSDKRIVIFAVGASPPRESTLNEIRDSNFSQEQQRNLTFYYLRGGFDFNKLDFTNKILMTFLKAKLKLKRERNRSPDEIGMLAAYSKPMDWTKKEKIKGIVDYVRSLAQ